MKKLLNSLLVIVFLASCSNNDDNENVNQPRLIEVTEVITINGELTEFGPGNSVTYEYGSNNFVNRIISSGGNTTEYIYNTNNQIITEIFTDSHSDTNYEINYNYENELIINENYSVGGNSNDFIYNNNQLEEIHYNNTISGNSSSISLIYDSNNNIINRIDSSTSEVYDSFSYDNKINPFSLLFPESYNMIKQISNNNKVYSETYNVEITYEYNNFDLPINSVYTQHFWQKDREFFYE